MSNHKEGFPSQNNRENFDAPVDKGAAQEKQDKIVRATRVVHKILARDRRSLVEGLIEDKEGWRTLLSQQAEFVARNTEKRTVVELDPSIDSLLPKEFWDNPTAWIEAQQLLFGKLTHKEYTAPHFHKTGLPTINEMYRFTGNEYDQYRIRTFSLPQAGSSEKIDIISKRITPLIFERAIDEVKKARAAFAAGVPTPRIYGEIFDQGNVYIWQERIKNAKNMREISEELSSIFSSHHDGYSDVFTSIEKNGYIDNPEEQAWLDSMKRNIEGQRAGEDVIDEVNNLFYQWYKTRIKEGNESLVELSAPVGGRKYASWILSEAGRSRIRADVQNMATELTGQTDGLSRIFKGSSFENSITMEKFLAATMIEYLRKMTRFRYDPFAEAFKQADGVISGSLDLGVNDEEIKKILEQRDVFIRNVLEMRKKVTEFASQKILGFPSADVFHKYIQTMLSEKKIKHPDLHFGNIVIVWDEKTHRAVQDEHGKAKFYIIDWEPKYKKPNTF